VSPVDPSTETLLNWDTFSIQKAQLIRELAFLKGFDQIQKWNLTKDYFHYCKCIPDFLFVTSDVSCQEKKRKKKFFLPQRELIFLQHTPSQQPSQPFTSPGHRVESFLPSS
jgi:hypothetical protein